jgi:acetyl-CoA C-acetyltransferase
MSSRSTDPRSPCLVGTARRTWRQDETTPEPLEQWAQLARAALVDAADGARSSATVDLDAVDHVGLVHCQSWAYDDPGVRLAERLGLRPGVPVQESILAGTSPQRLLDAAAARMLRGEATVALVVGAEALAARKVYDRAGAPPPWSHPHPSPPLFPVDLDQWYLPTELSHGVLQAYLTFALLDQARWGERGATAEDRAHTASVLDHLNEVASNNPDAWFTERRTGSELTTVAADNRMIATPYTKRMTSFLDVDMAAANLLVTHAVADEWGVPPERRLYLRGWGFARDAVHLAARRELGRSPAMVDAQGQALEMAGLAVEDIDVFDLYSCFPSAVSFATDALGLSPEDPRPLTVTGGLAYHGGPSSNYMSHAISHVTERLRAAGGTGMVTGVGMHMTKHVAAVWSTEPGTLHHPADHGPQWWSEPSGGAGSSDRPVVPALSGPVRVLAASVVHDPGVDPWAVAICERDDGARGYARSTAPDVVAAVADDAWVGALAVVEPQGDVNDLKL